MTVLVKEAPEKIAAQVAGSAVLRSLKSALSQEEHFLRSAPETQPVSMPVLGRKEELAPELAPELAQDSTKPSEVPHHCCSWHPLVPLPFR